MEMSESTELRIVASDPCTAPDVLGELARSSDRTTRQYVAANPNTPTEVLLNLGEEFPEQVLENPIFSLLLLENPNLVAEIPYNTLASLLKYETVPDSFIEWVMNNRRGDSQIHLALAMNAKTPKNVLKGLLESSNYSEVKELVQLHVNFAGELTESWERFALGAIWNTALNGQKYGQYIEQLAKINSIPKYLIVIPEWFEHTLPKSDTYFKETANNPKTTVKGLSHFATDNNDDGDLRLVAKNPNTPVKVLSKLATDNDVTVRLHVAFNPNIPVNILSQLAKDNNSVVREYVAKNPNTPTSVLEQILGDRSEKILQFVVARYLAHNPDQLSFVLQHYPKDYQPSYSRLVILFHPQVPTNLLVENRRSNAWLERYAIAQHPNTPPDTLEILAKDANRIVRAAAKANLQTRPAPSA